MPMGIRASEASTFDVEPCVVDFAYTPSVRSASEREQFKFQASAGFCVSACKFCGWNLNLISALASAEPRISSIDVSTYFKGKQSSESYSGNVEKFSAEFVMAWIDGINVLGIAHVIDGLMFSRARSVEADLRPQSF